MATTSIEIECRLYAANDNNRKSPITVLLQPNSPATYETVGEEVTNAIHKLVTETSHQPRPAFARLEDEDGGSIGDNFEFNENITIHVSTLMFTMPVRVEGIGNQDVRLWEKLRLEEFLRNLYSETPALEEAGVLSSDLVFIDNGSNDQIPIPAWEAAFRLASDFCKDIDTRHSVKTNIVKIHYQIVQPDQERVTANPFIQFCEARQVQELWKGIVSQKGLITTGYSTTCPTCVLYHGHELLDPDIHPSNQLSALLQVEQRDKCYLSFAVGERRTVKCLVLHDNKLFLYTIDVYLDSSFQDFCDTVSRRAGIELDTTGESPVQVMVNGTEQRLKEKLSSVFGRQTIESSGQYCVTILPFRLAYENFAVIDVIWESTNCTFDFRDFDLLYRQSVPF